MTDLRELLYEPWGEGSFSPGTHSSPLATRMPECVPEGLEWEAADCRWYLGESPLVLYITDDQATLLCIGRWVQVLSEGLDGGALEILAATNWVVTGVFKPEADHVDFVNASLPAALAAALHRLADAREES